MAIQSTNPHSGYTNESRTVWYCRVHQSEAITAGAYYYTTARNQPHLECPACVRLQVHEAREAQTSCELDRDSVGSTHWAGCYLEHAQCGAHVRAQIAACIHDNIHSATCEHIADLIGDLLAIQKDKEP